MSKYRLSKQMRQIVKAAKEAGLKEVRVDMNGRGEHARIYAKGPDGKERHVKMHRGKTPCSPRFTAHRVRELLP